MAIFISFLVTIFSFSVFANPMEWQALRAEAIRESRKPFLPVQDKNGRFLARPEASAVASGTYQQKIDHDNITATETFSQRYWITKNKIDTAPVLLFICGEGECGDYFVRGVLANHAAAIGANMVALEHRYYGMSQPYPDLSTENLKHLTVDYALKDILRFQDFARSDLRLNGDWVAVGGSYSGALAAFLRAHYPSRFVGALASSAPVLADNDFSEYDRHVGQQAGPACVSAIQGVVALADQAVLDAKKFAEIKTKFGADVLKNPEDFLYFLADTAAAAVQYGMKDSFCAEVTTSGLDGYVKGSQMVAGIFGSLVNLSAQAAENIDLATGTGSIGMRQWFYQSCKEFGYWQNVNADPSLQTRSLRINENYHRGICKRLFDMDDFADVTKTNDVYYEKVVESGSNIFFTNGSEDPWINLSIADATAYPALESYVIAGAAHCDDLGANAKARPAQTRFVELTKKWLGMTP